MIAIILLGILLAKTIGNYLELKGSSYLYKSDIITLCTPTSEIAYKLSELTNISTCKIMFQETFTIEFLNGDIVINSLVPNYEKIKEKLIMLLRSKIKNYDLLLK